MIHLYDNLLFVQQVLENITTQEQLSVYTCRLNTIYLISNYNYVYSLCVPYCILIIVEVATALQFIVWYNYIILMDSIVHKIWKCFWNAWKCWSVILDPSLSLGISINPKPFASWLLAVRTYWYTLIKHFCVVICAGMPRRCPSKSNSTSLFRYMPVNMCNVADFIPEMASRWVMIGDKLDVHNEVMCLENRQEGDIQKCQKILSAAIDQGKVSHWQQLLDVLESEAVKLPNVANNIRQTLNSHPTPSSV